MAAATIFIKDLVIGEVKDFDFKVDHNSFNPDNSQTYQIPVGSTFSIPRPKVPKFIVRYDISEFRYPFPEVPNVFIGGCGAKDLSHKEDIFTFVVGLGPLAHTHMCPNDPLKNSICLPFIEYVRVKDIMWHEYGHVKTPILSKVECRPGTTKHIFKGSNLSDLDSDGHGPRWRQTMIDLGQPHLTGPYFKDDGSTLYNLFDKP